MQRKRDPGVPSPSQQQVHSSRVVVSGPPWELEIPCKPLEPISDAARQALRTEAFRINDRYLLDFIEGYSFCPFSRGGRRRNQVSRYFHYADSCDIAPLLELMAEIAADPRQVVAQVVLPLIEVEPKPWVRFVQSLTELGNRRIGDVPTLACAALHPQLQFTAANANTLIPLFRRSPDPTIQWVRLDGLEAIYEGRNHRTRFVPPEDIAELLATPAPQPLYDRIAESNQSMAARLGLPYIVDMLQDMRHDAQRSYARVLLAAED